MLCHKTSPLSPSNMLQNPMGLLHPSPMSCVRGAEGMLNIMGMAVGSPALATHSLLFTLQLCVEFIKNTLSVEQVCEALQVSGTWL